MVRRFLEVVCVSAVLAGAGCGSVSIKTDAGRQTDSAADVPATDAPAIDAPADTGSTDGGAPDSAIADAPATDVPIAPDAGPPADGGAAVVLLESAILSVGGTTAATGITIEDDGFEELGPNCSTDGTVCLFEGGLEP